jgi:hypothetical protein
LPLKIQKILGKLRDVEQELEAIGENMKQLEISAEKAQEREEKLKDKIHSLMERLKVAEARFEYGEMNVSKLNLRYTNHFHLTSHTSSRLMPCPFIGPKMFYVGPNFLSQPDNLTAFSASSKTFLPTQKPILQNANHLFFSRKMFVTGTICK